MKKNRKRPLSPQKLQLFPALCVPLFLGGSQPGTGPSPPLSFPAQALAVAAGLFAAPAPCAETRLWLRLTATHRGWPEFTAAGDPRTKPPVLPSHRGGRGKAAGSLLIPSLPDRPSAARFVPAQHFCVSLISLLPPSPPCPEPLLLQHSCSSCGRAERRGITLPREQGGKLYKNFSLFFLFSFLQTGQSVLPPFSGHPSSPCLTCTSSFPAPAALSLVNPCRSLHRSSPCSADREKRRQFHPEHRDERPSRQLPPLFTSAPPRRPAPSPRWWQRRARPRGPRGARSAPRCRRRRRPRASRSGWRCRAPAA